LRVRLRICYTNVEYTLTLQDTTFQQFMYRDK